MATPESKVHPLEASDRVGAEIFSSWVPVPLLKAILSKRVKVVDEPETVLMYIPFAAVFLTLSPSMFRTGVALPLEPTVKV